MGTALSKQGPSWVVIGSNGQIGSALVKALANQKATVITVDRSNADFVQDFLDYDGVQGTMRRLFLATSGDLRVVYTVGGGPSTHHLDRSSQEIDSTLALNLGSAVMVLAELTKYLDGSGQRARCLFFSSVYARRVPDFEIYSSLPRRNSEVYGAAKAGLEALVRYYAVVGANSGLTVNALSLGGVYDPITHNSDFVEAYGQRVATKQMIEIDEVVDMVLFMMQTSSSNLTGATIALDGGFAL